MNVEILQATDSPISFISKIAGICYGHEDEVKKRVERCINKGHTSVLEHAVFTAKISGISRACSHQLVRHRIASYTQASQRYVKILDEEYYTAPESCENSSVFEEAMKSAQATYKQLLSEGVPAEDARYVLPNASKTDIVMTMNARSLLNCIDVRIDPHAQAEIRHLFIEIVSELAKWSEGWFEFISMLLYASKGDEFCGILEKN